MNFLGTRKGNHSEMKTIAPILCRNYESIQIKAQATEMNHKSYDFHANDIK